MPSRNELTRLANIEKAKLGKPAEDEIPMVFSSIPTEAVILKPKTKKKAAKKK